MKRLVLLAFAAFVAFGFAGRADAQDAFAPLVQKETTAIVRVDLTKLDSQLLSAQLLKVANAAVDYFVADQKQAEETKQTLPLITALSSQYFGSFVQPIKDAGVSEAFVVFDQSPNADAPLYPYLAIPTAGLTEDQIKDARAALATLNKNANSALKYRFVRAGFIFAPMIPESVSEDDAKSYVKKRFAKLASVDPKNFVDGFQVLGNDAALTLVGVAGNESAVRAQVESSLAQVQEQLGDEEKDVQEFVEKMTNAQVEFAKLVQFTAWKGDLEKLQSTSFVQTGSEANAAKYLELVGGLKTDVSAFVEKLLDKNLADSESQADPATVAELKQAINSLIDAIFGNLKADGATVVFVVDGKFFADNEAVIKGLIETAQKMTPQDEAPIDEDDETDAESEDDGELDLEAL